MEFIVAAVIISPITGFLIYLLIDLYKIRKDIKKGNYKINLEFIEKAEERIISELKAEKTININVNIDQLICDTPLKEEEAKQQVKKLIEGFQKALENI